MTGQTPGHYQILEKLESGGMSEVYKARDARLNRLVAIKVPPPEEVANAGRKRRFILEAQSASALTPPPIPSSFTALTRKTAPTTWRWSTSTERPSMRLFRATAGGLEKR